MGWVIEERLTGMAGVLADIVYKTDQMSKKEISRNELAGFRLKMKLIKQIVKMEATKFGTRPVH